MSKKMEEKSSDQSIRVACRFRPPNKLEKSRDDFGKVIEISANCKTLTINTGKKTRDFTFDHVFGENTTQLHVFNKIGLPLVDSVLDGYNCTLFAYGQTGSGKTYSMEGNLNSNEHQGLLPRITTEIFRRILQSNDNNIEYTCRVSYIEIYNEKFKDLLNPENKDIRVRETKGKNGVYIENVEQPYADSPNVVFQHLVNGQLNRSIASTRMNQHSSRSHAVFMLLITQKSLTNGSTKHSKLMMVDLAGSEKVRKTNATGQTLKEAQGINKSLMCLGLVMNCLVEGKKHIPYRDSKLTRLLSDALGGNSKTFLLVAASPCEYNKEETVSTLRFASRAKKVQNKAKVNQELSIAQYKVVLSQRDKEISLLKHELSQSKNIINKLTNECKKNNIDINKILDDISKISTSKPKLSLNNNSSSSQKQNTNTNDEHTILEYDKLKQEKNKLFDENERLKEDIDELKEELNIANDTEQQLINENNGLKNSVRKIETQLLTMKQNVQTFKSKALMLQPFQREVEETRKQIHELTQHNIGLGRTIMELKRNNGETSKNIMTQSTSNLIREYSDGKNNSDEDSEDDINNNKNNIQIKIIEKLKNTMQMYYEKYLEIKEENVSLKARYKALESRDAAAKSIRDDWSKQMTEMEAAMMLASQIFHSERQKHIQEVNELNLKIEQLKKFCLTLTSTKYGNKRSNMYKPIKPQTTTGNDVTETKKRRSLVRSRISSRAIVNLDD